MKEYYTPAQVQEIQETVNCTKLMAPLHNFKCRKDHCTIGDPVYFCLRCKQHEPGPKRRRKLR